MSRPALIRQSDVARIARAAKDAGVRAEVQIGDVVIRIFPNDKPSETPQDEPRERFIL